MPTHTPQSGYHGVTEVAKTANIAKTAEKFYCLRQVHSQRIYPKQHTPKIE